MLTGVGTHLVLELWGCRNLNSLETVEQALRDIVDAIDVTLLDLKIYPFSPQGVTGAAIVAESHIIIHTWPEHGYAAIDIFTCGKERDLERALESVREHFAPDRIQAMNMVRGIVVD